MGFSNGQSMVFGRSVAFTDGMGTFYGAGTYLLRDRDVFIMSGAIVVGNVRYPLAKMSGLYIARRSHAIGPG